MQMARDEEEEENLKCLAGSAKYLMEVLTNLQAGLEILPTSTELFPRSIVLDYFAKAGVIFFFFFFNNH